MKITPPLMRAVEVADWLGVPQQRVYELARSGLIPSIKLGRSYRFSQPALESFMTKGGQGLSDGWRHKQE